MKFYHPNLLFSFIPKFRTYDKPLKLDSYQLEMAGRNFYHAKLTSVKGKSSAPVDLQIDFDVQRYLWGDRGVVSEHPGYKLLQKRRPCILPPFLRAGGITLISMDRIKLWISL